MSKRAPRVLGAVVSAAVTVLATMTILAPNASAAAVPRGKFAAATQLTNTRAVTITGWAFDPARPNSAAGIMIYLNGRYIAWGPTNAYSAPVNRAYHLTGLHSFRITVRPKTSVSTVAIKLRSTSTGKLVTVASARVGHYTPPTARIIASAKKYYAAHVPYREGGASPRGFDCSGYTQYVYREAVVSWLPRTAEQQRRATKRISRSQLQPGDLVFYLSGGSAYHVAIYAGNGMQYSAATPRDGLRYQKIWSSAVQYGTTWH